jgi:hypothetical protein
VIRSLTKGCTCQRATRAAGERQYGAYWAAQCYDDKPGPQPDPREGPFAASHRAECEGLGIRRPSADQTPITNDVPILIFAPELDPVRSAANARASDAYTRPLHHSSWSHA